MEPADAALLMSEVKAFEAGRAHPVLQLPRLRFVLRQRDMRKPRLVAIANHVILMGRAGRRRLSRPDPHELLEIPQHPLRVRRIGPMAKQPEMMRADVEGYVRKQKVVKIIQ